MNCVVVFGREPQAGRVKTRLARGIGDQAAAAVYGELLADTLRAARATNEGVILSLADAPTGDWRAPDGAAIEVQSGEDLGLRLDNSFTRRFGDGYDRVVIIGSDCPALKSRHIVEAFERLADVPVVLGPAGDGGYWLIGQRAPGRLDLTGLPWSSPKTLSATRARLCDLGLDWNELEELRDVDRPEDLQWALTDPEIDRELSARLKSAATTARRESP